MDGFLGTSQIIPKSVMAGIFPSRAAVNRSVDL